MQRFKFLLDKYNRDTLYEDGHSMTYDEWAKLEVKRRKRALRNNKNANNNQENTGDGITGDDLGEGRVITKRKGIRKGKIVEVMRLLSSRKSMDNVVMGGSTQSNQGSKKSRAKKKTNKKNKKSISSTESKNGKGDEQSELRIALKGRKSAFSLDTKVICKIQSEEGGDIFVLGVVSVSVENHVRIHFVHTTKNEDVWVQVDSNKLFLDGGPLPVIQPKKGKQKKGAQKKILSK